MAHHKDAIKRIRQSEDSRARNRHYRSQVRNQVKRVRDAIDSGDKDAAQAQFRQAVSVIQRVAGKGIIHRNQAARRIKRLNAAVAKM